MEETNSQITLLDILAAASERGASDVHLVAATPPMARISGQIIPLFDFTLDPQVCRDLILSGLTENQRIRLEETWELDFILEVESLGRFRGNCHYSRGHVEAAYRLIPGVIPELNTLGHRESILQLCNMDQGMILVTGTTGSGKSTTLASMVQRISQQRSGIIVTVEDPAEFVFQNGISVVKQREIGADTKSFAAALKHVLRQDPDVIVISEMRDLETMHAAITAAETGHLVIGTLHTMDAAKSLDRMVDVFPSEQQNQIITQLANCLRAVLSQRLLPKADGTGRVLASELMIMNTAIRSCLRDRKTQHIPGMIEIGKQDGMFSLDETLIELFENGSITREEAIFNAHDPTRIPVEQKKKKGFFG